MRCLSQVIRWNPAWAVGFPVSYIRREEHDMEQTRSNIDIHDWDARASEALANAKKLPLGSKRAEAIKKAGQLRVAADMKDLLMTKESAEQRKAAAV